MRSGAGKLIGLLLLLAAPQAASQSVEERHRRADVALQSLLLKFWSQELGYLRHQYPGPVGRTGYWTFAQGFDALLDGVERTGGERYAGLVETFYNAQDRRGWMAGYYDDENWMALALLRAHDLTGKDRYLQTALLLWEDIRSAWDTTCCPGQRGGLWWDKAHTQKATAANAGAVITGVRIAERTGDASALEFAEQVYRFWFDNMVDPGSHQVTDHIVPTGEKFFWKFSYNEGLMIGASVELHRATGDPAYLDNATRIAAFLLVNEIAAVPGGRVLHDGTASSCTGDCHAFKGPAYRYFLLLYQALSLPVYGNLLESSAFAIWDLARTPSENLFSVSWVGPAMSSYSEPQTVAAVMALNLHAALSGPYPGSGASRNLYEAEDAAIGGVGLEDRHAGFTGWGYAAGFGSDGQRVDFTVRVQAPGAYELIFQYAAETGDASRRIDIGGETVSDNLVFPGTGAWENYATVAVARDLQAGDQRISVIHDSARGSAGFLNLDHLLLRPLSTHFRRGDANSDATVDIADAVRILLHLFGAPSRPISCVRSADADSSGAVDVTDAVYLLQHLFLLGPAPREPFPGCGPEVPEGTVPCESYPPCE